MAREARPNPKKVRATRVEGVPTTSTTRQLPGSAFCLTCLKCSDYFLFRNYVTVDFVPDYFLVCIVTDYFLHSNYRGSS
jgi:hypothetical protein